MKVAIVHAHFRPGGVTRVVANAVAALQGHGVEIAAFSGQSSAGNGLPLHTVVPGLDYDDAFRAGAGEALARRLREAAREVFGGEPDLWHFHNHSLGKNANFPATIRAFARSGVRLLLQIHDFAEDGRPRDYQRMRQGCPDDADFAASIYPAAPQIHYALINLRDAAAIRAAGAPARACHYLPNPVSMPAAAPVAEPLFPEAGRFLLYPTRAIRRKNIGELLLLAATTRTPTRFATTLRPDNPQWQPIHDRWEEIAHELNLPVTFGLAEKHDFAALLARANAIITTSVAEGFGLAFLEPALSGKPIVGRNLPEITPDFHQWGIHLNHLYDSLPVPEDSIDPKDLRRRIEASLNAQYTAFDRTLPGGAVERALDSMRTHPGWDFGRLDESLQEGVIRDARENPARFAPLASVLEPLPSAATVDTQRQKIREHLSLDRYGHRLASIYSAVINSPQDDPSALDTDSILSTFLNPQRLNLLLS